MIRNHSHKHMIYLFNKSFAPDTYATAVNRLPKVVRWMILFITLALASCNNDDDPDQATDQSPDTFLDQCTITFADVEQAQTLLQTSDEYTRQLGAFDLQSKTGNSGATTEADYLAYAAQQAQAWSEEEINQLRSAIDSAEKRIQALGLNLDLPSEIVLVRSSMQEEGGAAGYTRQNFIVLGELSNVPVEYLFLHELFHVYSRFNPEKRDALYATIGFQKTNEISLPPSLEENKISNPDAPVLDHVIALTIDGKPQEAVFFLYADRDYQGGSFFDYLNKRLLLVEKKGDDYQVLLQDGQPILRPYEDASDLRDKIGRNTSYDIDPEEVMADHFTLLILGVNVREPSYLAQVQRILE